MAAMYRFNTLLQYLILFLFVISVLNAIVLIKIADIPQSPQGEPNQPEVIGNVIGIVTMMVQACGDGLIHGTEQCDGAALNGSSCVSLGYVGGNLSCRNNCTYNTTVCNLGGGFNGNSSSCNTTNISNLNITIDENGTTAQKYFDVHQAIFRNGSTPLFNFSYNFSQGNITLANVSIAAAENGIVVNLHGQLQGENKKSLHLTDAGFGQLCVEDAEIETLADISEGCSGAGEIDFTSCIGKSAGTTISGITCYDEGTAFRFDNLQHSGVRGGEFVEGSGGEAHNKKGKKESNPSAAQSTPPAIGSSIESAHREVANKDVVSNARPSTTPIPTAPMKSKLFDIEVDIIEEFKEINPNEEIYAEISLFYLGDEQLGKRMDVNVYYAILNNNNQIVSEKLETIGIETRMTFVAKLGVPLGAASGEYWFYSRISVDNEIAESFAPFSVLSEKPMVETPLFIPQQYVLIVIFILSIFMLVIVHHQYRLEKHLAKHDGKLLIDDLIRSGQIIIRQEQEETQREKEKR